MLISDPDDVANKLSDGVVESCDRPHNFRDSVNFVPELFEPARLQQVVQVLDVLHGRVVQHLLTE